MTGNGSYVLNKCDESRIWCDESDVETRNSMSGKRARPEMCMHDVDTDVMFIMRKRSLRETCTTYFLESK